MQLYFWDPPHGNFGDELNRWIWDDLLPGWQDWDPARYLFGVGTLLSAASLDRQPCLVAGSGTGFARIARRLDPGQADIAFVRGPMTAASLGLPPDRAAIDPAAALPRLLPVRADERGSGGTVFIPHESSDTAAAFCWPRICGEAGIAYLSPRCEARAVIGRIARAGCVITESMHGAIIADAFRVPWIAVRLGPAFNRFKWLDWAASVGVGLDLHDLPPPPAERPAPAFLRRPPFRTVHGALSRLRRPGAVPSRAPSRWMAYQSGLAAELARLAQGPGHLSDAQRLDDAVGGMFACLDGIRRRYG